MRYKNKFTYRNIILIDRLIFSRIKKFSARQTLLKIFRDPDKIKVVSIDTVYG